MEVKPTMASIELVCWTLRKTWSHVSMKPSASMCSPSRSLICDVAMVTADAAVKPAMTGGAMNSMRKPKLNRPRPSTMQPLRKASTDVAAIPIRLCVIAADDSSDMSAVGPIVTVGVLPSTTYTKQPMNAEYSPYYRTTTPPTTSRSSATLSLAPKNQSTRDYVPLAVRRPP